MQLGLTFPEYQRRSRRRDLSKPQGQKSSSEHGQHLTSAIKRMGAVDVKVVLKC